MPLQHIGNIISYAELYQIRDTKQTVHRNYNSGTYDKFESVCFNWNDSQDGELLN